MREKLAGLVLLACVGSTAFAPSAHAGKRSAPEWVRPALHYLDDHGYMDASDFRANRAMARSDFKKLMGKAFGGGYRRFRGKVTAGEVSAALVRKLGYANVAQDLDSVKSPDGWDPEVAKSFGTEIVAREFGLRHDRPTNEESKESSAAESMPQADIVWAVWKAKTSPSTYAADALESFRLSNYDSARRRVVKFALSLVGTPYVWGGEWITKTPSGYPYGAQSHGGVDCSGFLWYVLRKSAPGWNPVGRPYKGWEFSQRSSADMAAATKDRLGYRELKPGDAIFFASGGRKAKPSSVYHAGLYLGKGWMVHSSGSRAGISLAEVGRGAWWHDQIIFGRRIIR